MLLIWYLFAIYGLLSLFAAMAHVAYCNIYGESNYEDLIRAIEFMKNGEEGKWTAKQTLMFLVLQGVLFTWIGYAGIL